MFPHYLTTALHTLPQFAARAALMESVESKRYQLGLSEHPSIHVMRTMSYCHILVKSIHADTKSEGFPNPTTLSCWRFLGTFMDLCPTKRTNSRSIILSHASFDTRIAKFLDPDIGQLLECVENHLPFHAFQLVE